ncbi:MAG: class I SAM-dependent methyltransferase [Acidobacteriia bacterium]|nr:class I SAM-dependent methyltransferase [Terriglobia bacterium]
MKAFRKLLQRTPFYGLYKAAGHYPDYWYWKLRGEPVRSPHLVKQRAVLEYAQRYGLHVLVETGTYYGEMVAAMKNRFQEIHSVEFDSQLAQQAQKKFARWPHIHILEGDSQKKIPELLQTLNQPALFWLDAGYYGWAGLQGDKQRLTTELETILSHRIKEHVILMDDARGLNGENGSPTVDQLKQRIAAQFPGRVVEVKHDILRITPAISK